MRINPLLSSSAQVASILLAVFALALGTASAKAELVIDSLSGWNGSDSNSDFGEGGTRNLGQIFSTTTDDFYLKDFTFRAFNLDQASNLDLAEVNYKVRIAEWNDSTRLIDNSPTSSPINFLYTSDTQTIGTEVTDYEDFTLTPGVVLAADTDYVIFLSVIGADVSDGDNDRLRIATRANGATSISGDLVVSTRDLESLDTQTPSGFPDTWQTFGSSGSGFDDLAFTITLLPEPTTASFVAVLSLVCLKRRRLI
ncbi:MAG: hypothetical protein AAF086_06820 [Planctomycetota bacterium]